jgi:hypothetical protein
MKEIVITQIYEVSVSYTVEVEDNVTEPEAIDRFGEMEVSVTIDKWEESRGGTEMKFGGIDSVDCITTYVNVVKD